MYMPTVSVLIGLLCNVLYCATYMYAVNTYNVNIPVNKDAIALPSDQPWVINDALLTNL